MAARCKTALVAEPSGAERARLGEMAAEQAIQVLKDGAHVGDLPIGFASEADMKYVFNEEVANKIGIAIPENLK